MEQFLLIATAHFIALLSPGPDLIYVLKSATSYRFRIASGAAFGIAFSNGFYILLTLLGYAKVVANSDVLILCIQIIGGLYLSYLGVMILRTDSKALKVTKQSKTSSFAKEFLQGLLTSILNPKISLFYLSLFTLVIDPSTPSQIQIGYGIWMFCVVLVWDLIFIYLITKHLAQKVLFMMNSLEKVLGLMLFGIGIGLLVQILQN